jgi:hypothetical protein
MPYGIVSEIVTNIPSNTERSPLAEAKKPPHFPVKNSC